MALIVYIYSKKFYYRLNTYNHVFSTIIIIFYKVLFYFRIVLFIVLPYIIKKKYSYILYNVFITRKRYRYYTRFDKKYNKRVTVRNKGLLSYKFKKRFNKRNI